MDDAVTTALLQAARAYRARSAKLLTRIGLYPGQDALLSLLSTRGATTMGEAAAALSIQPPTVTKMVHRLAGAGLVRSEVMDRDRRKIIISITDAARAKITEIDAIRKALEAEALDGLEAEELREKLEALAQNLSSKDEEQRAPAQLSA